MTAINVHPLRGCQLCMQHRVLDGKLLCAHPLVAGALQLVPCELARYGELGVPGGCGPNAGHQQLRGESSPLTLAPFAERQAA